MNTPVSFDIAKLLKEKGFDNYCDKKYVAKCLWQSPNNREKYKNSEIHKNSSDVSAPTIADVVMWLYETHDIWIMIDMTGSKKFYPRGRMIDKKGKHHVGDFKYNSERLIYNSPIEAYEAAINYCLINLI